MATTAGGLPVSLTSFIGRRRDQAEIEWLLGRARLVTLVGPGGCGKSRLALEIARGLAESGTPVHWVELSSVADPDGVAAAVMTATGARDDAGPTAVEATAAVLGEVPGVVVLDNCEHQLVAVGRLVRNLLAAAGELVIMATSREPIGVGGEATWAVGPLRGPDEIESVSAREVLATDAGRLFADRARAANPSFTLTDHEAPAVARVIRRLDGLPLALELAAVRCRAMSPGGIADALDDRFVLLTGGDPTADPRQQTLLASVDWSHDLLPPAERTLLRRLGIFAGPFTTRAAEAVTAAAGLSMVDVLPALIRLVDKSLVAIESGDGADRYRLLESIRAFALGQLELAGEREATAARHARFFAARAAAAAVGVDEPGRDEWLVAVDYELADLDQARQEALAVGEPAVAAEIAADLTRYWCCRGRYRSALDALSQVLPLVSELDGRIGARVLWAASHTALCAGDVLAASGHATAAVSLARRAGDESVLARALAAQAGALAMLDPAAAEPVFAEATALARATGDRWCLGSALVNQALSTIHVAVGDGSDKELAEAGEIARAIGDPSLVAWHAVALGWQANRAGHVVPAERHLRHAIEVAGTVGDGAPVDLATGFLAEVLGWQGRHDEARAVMDEGIDRLEQQDADLVAPLRLELGILHLLAGEPAEALEVFRTCAASPIVALLDHLGAQADLGFGAASLALGRVEEAVDSLQRAVDRPGVASPWVLAMGQALLGEARRQAGRPAPLAPSAAGLALATRAGFGTVQIEALELFAAEAAGTGVEGAAFGAKLLGTTRTARQQRALLPGVPFLSRGAEAERLAVEALGAESFAAAMAEGAALDLDAASAEALSAFGGNGSPGRRPTSGWESLTAAEWRVAELAASGRSNPQIADDLFISRETVKSHLSRVFAKLSVINRAELAAAWARRQQ